MSSAAEQSGHNAGQNPGREPDKGADTPKRIAFIYSPRYHVDIGPHVFFTNKYDLLRERMITELRVGAAEFLEPKPASQEQLLLVHTAEYLADLKELRRTARTIYSELPLTREIVEAYFICAGGSILAARKALELGGCGFHLGGGFHHAFPDHAEGFCYLNDIAVAIRVMQKEKRVKRAIVVDCDVHQGNGTAVIFQGDPHVFTFSIHQENLYPLKQQSDLDIGLPDFTDTQLYMKELRRVIPSEIDRFAPQLVVFVAGADTYERDLLGNLRLSLAGLRARDELVLGACKERGIAVMVVLAGGYASRVEETVAVHFQTAQVAYGLFLPNQDGRRESHF